ncbi:MAG: diguanylate cyclase [Acidobacteria bacterium]|jgi:diguanylate cyclase (GGDEF)-like protein|nr:diguanylate cyclase [Acidobacteriota bacterium]
MKRASFLFFLLVLALPLLSVRYPFINYRSSAGLPQSNITALLQDRDGFIWVGTQAGLGRFDGSRFETFTSQEGLAGNFITGLEMDRDGAIWVSSQDGLNRILGGRISAWPLPDNFVRAIAYSGIDFTLWVLTADALYTVRDGVTSRYNRFADATRLGGLASGATGMAFFSSDAVFLLRNGSLQRYPGPEAINFVKETAGHLFIGCQGGLYILNPFGEFKKYSGLPAGMNNVSDILFDGRNNLWIASRSGVFHKNLQTGSATALSTANGLVYDRASKLLLDRENNVFIGSEFGLSQLSRHLFRMYGPEDGLPSTQVWDMLEHGGGVLLACDDGIAELRDGRLRPFAVNARLKNRSIRAIVRLEDRRFLLGCREGEILEWDGGDRLRSLTVGVNTLYAIRDSRGRAWFATDRGLLRYDGSEFRWFRSGLNDLIVWDVAELEPGSLLVGTRRGLQLFRDEAFVASEWEKLVGRVVINDIRVVSPREVLVASEMSGVYWLRDGTLTRITQEQGLLHNDIWSVLRDDSGNIWLNSTRALERIGPDSAHAFFNSQTGLFGDEGCVHAALKAANGNLYFGIVPGLVEYACPAGVVPAPMPVLVIRDPLVNGSPRRLPFTAALRHDQDTIEFRFICPTTSHENPMSYKTRLFPFDSDWSSPGRATSVRYTNLPPGTYTFSVLASSGGTGNWTGADRRIIFSIAAPFWKRWWFLVLEALLGLGLVLLFIKLRVGALEKQKRRLEGIVQSRTNEIAEKNRELALLSITDPLTGLKNRRFLDETIREDTSIIQRELHNVRSGKKPFDEKAAALGVFMLDVDHFKKVNDLHGHEAGDAVIIEIASRLQAMMRQSDTVVRWGGEEFMIITRQASQADALQLAERVRQGIEKAAFQMPGGQHIKKTVSIGFCHYPFLSGDQEKLSWQQVVSMADNALYLAKHNGRNLVIGIRPGPVPFAGAGQELFADLAAAVRDGHLQLICGKDRVKIPEHP